MQLLYFLKIQVLFYLYKSLCHKKHDILILSKKLVYHNFIRLILYPPKMKISDKIPLGLIKYSSRPARETRSRSTLCDFWYFYGKKAGLKPDIYLSAGTAHCSPAPYRFSGLFPEANLENSLGTLSSRRESPARTRERTKRSDR